MAYTVLHKPKGKIRERLLLVGGFETALYDALKETDLLVEQVLEGREALACASQRQYGVVLCSLRMEGVWGLDVLDAIRKADSLTPVIISTGEKNPKVVVEAMRHGAFDYLIEPHVDLPAVLRVLERAVRARAALCAGDALRAALDRGELQFFQELIGHSPPLRALCEQIRVCAGMSSPVLIEGESGTGKELVARAIHRASGRRGPCVAVHCGAIPENLLESELFGHEKGAFTGAGSTHIGVFEEADGGTLFLDEVGLMSAACQKKLLRVLESNLIRRVGASREFKVDARVVAASNEPLRQLVAAKSFRQDLLYRLNVFTLQVPPLRERREDIPLLSYYFAQKFAKEAGKPFAAFSAEALAALSSYSYPGNVRELRNHVNRAVVFSREAVIALADLPEEVRRLAPAGSAAAVNEAVFLSDPWLRLNTQLGLPERLKLIEKALIEEALLRTGGNHSRAAKALQIKRTTLLSKMSQLGLKPATKHGSAARNGAKKKY